MKKPNHCLDCGKEITGKTRCQSCYIAYTRTPEFAEAQSKRLTKYEREYGTEALNTGSIIYWDTRTRRKTKEPNVRTRPFVKVLCGKCTNTRWVSVHNIRDCKRRVSKFNGFCKECARNATWLERGRERPKTRKLTSHGYIKIYCPENPMADKRGEVYEHRLVMAEKLGRPLESYEHVHHLDGNKTNNMPANLELIEPRPHNIFTKLIAENQRLKAEIEHLQVLLEQ